MASDADRHWGYLIEVDKDGMTAAARQLRTLGLALIFGALGTIGLEMAARLLFGPISSAPAIVLLVLSMIVVFPTGVTCLIMPRSKGWAKIEITVGGDFLFGPTATGPGFLEYRKVRRVSLEISEGVIIGATIAARLSTIHARRIKEPAVLVRAIFEHGPDNIRWHRAWHPFRKLGREEVGALIEQSHAQSLEKLVPPSATLGRFREMFPPAQNWRERLFGKGASGTLNAISMQRPTGTSRYVMLMFLQMFEDGPATRTLRRSEPLPVVTFKMETAEPPPLEEVLSHIRDKCIPPVKHNRGPAEGTINMTIQGTPCRILCRLDNNSDTCCQIRLERMAE